MNLPDIRINMEYEQFSPPASIEKHIMEKGKGYLAMKRTMDISGSLCGLILALPLFIGIAILNKAENPSAPIFYKQMRVGKNGRTFSMFKFRSMIVGAEGQLEELRHLNEVEGAMFKIKDDPRVTKVGKFIRKTSIDELPQFWNVLCGDMSLVGPRPPLPDEVVEYSSYDKQRLLVTPGCTGLWQVSARNSVGFREMVELDLKYIRERSIRKDLSIIFRTLYVMVKSKDAY